MFGDATAGNTVRNNRIGTTADGTAALPNGEHGRWAINISQPRVADGATRPEDGPASIRCVSPPRPRV